MTGRIIRLVCLILMSLWVTSKAMVLSPLLGIPLIGCTIWYSINEITEMRQEKNEKNKSRKKSKGNKKVTKKSTN